MKKPTKKHQKAARQNLFAYDTLARTGAKEDWDCIRGFGCPMCNSLSGGECNGCLHYKEEPPLSCNTKVRHVFLATVSGDSPSTKEEIKAAARKRRDYLRRLYAKGGADVGTVASRKKEFGHLLED